MWVRHSTAEPYLTSFILLVEKMRAHSMIGRSVFIIGRVCAPALFTVKDQYTLFPEYLARNRRMFPRRGKHSPIQGFTATDGKCREIH